MPKLSHIEVITRLGLMKLPEEGGFFREAYKAREEIPGNTIPSDGRKRVYATDIYYLMTATEFNGFHRMRFSIEIVNFYDGDPAELVQIDPSGNLTKAIMGSDIGNGQVHKVIVPLGNWLGMRLLDGGEWALFGVTCVPGFEYEDFDGGSYAALIELFPSHAETIKRYTHY